MYIHKVILKKMANATVLVAVLVALGLAITPAANVLAQDANQNVTQNAQVKTSSAGLAVKVAPGEILPVSVKLANFGGGKRVDVQVNYKITSNESSKTLLTSSETVAVETTNDYVKTLQIPQDAAAGLYTIETSIAYQGQLVPASTTFTFTVEPKILGVYRSDFYLYGSIAAVLSFCIVILGYFLAKKRHEGIKRFAPLDYSNVPKRDRVFYELVSDTVMNMRQEVGSKALLIAARIDGLTIDQNTGRVIKIAGRPSKIVADLVLGYEKSLGKKVSFEFRHEEDGDTRKNN